MTLRLALAAALLLTPAVLGPPAAANPADGVSVGLDIGGVYIWGPTLNSFGTEVEDDPYDWLRDIAPPEEFRSFGPSGSLHVKLPFATFGSEGLFGRDSLRFDLEGAWVEGHFNHYTEQQPGEYFDIIAIDGSGVPDGLGDFAATDGDAALGFVFADLTLEHAMLDEEGTKLAFFAGPSLGYVRQQWDVLQTGSGGSFNYLVENTNSYYAGAVIGVAARAPLFDGLSGHIEASAAGLHAWSDLDASQSTASSLPIAVEDEQNGWGARLKVKAGLELVGNNWVRVNLDGTFFWHTNVPTIVNPDVGPGGNGLDARDPARIDHNSIIGAGAMITFTVPLN